MPTNPERHLARILSRYGDVTDYHDLILEALGDNVDVLPTEEDALAILERNYLSNLLEHDEASDYLAKVGLATLDRDALASELARCMRPTARRALRQIGKELSSGALTRTPQERLAQDERDLMAALVSLEREAPGSLHSIARKWRPAVRHISKQRFDEAALDLARKRRIVLHHHDYPAGLTDAERDALVTDTEGTYYVGAGLWGSA